MNSETYGVITSVLIDNKSRSVSQEPHNYGISTYSYSVDFSFLLNAVEYTGTSYIRTSSAPREGNYVTILYDDANPKASHIEGMRIIQGSRLPPILFACGTTVILLGVGYFNFHRRRLIFTGEPDYAYLDKQAAGNKGRIVFKRNGYYISNHYWFAFPYRKYADHIPIMYDKEKRDGFYTLREVGLMYDKKTEVLSASYISTILRLLLVFMLFYLSFQSWEFY